MADSAVSGGKDATGVKLSSSKRGGGGARDATRRSVIKDSIANSQFHIARQQEQIRKLVDENEKMKEEIERISGSQYDYVKADKLSTLQSEVDALERRCQFEKMRTNDLTKRHQLARIDLLHSRRMKGGVNVEREQAEAIQTQVDILETRLQHALHKFNDSLKFNRELRDRIDIIREERNVFARVHKKMDDDLRQRQRAMAESIEQTNKDMDERDNYQRQAEQLRQALRTQNASYEEKLCETNQGMDDIKTMRENQAAMQLELEAREYQFESLNAASNHCPTVTTMNNNNTIMDMAPGNSFNGPGMSGGEGVGNGAEGMRGLIGFPGDGPFTGEDEDQHVFKAALRVDNEPYTITEIVAKISEALHSSDMDALRREFVHLGDHNFSLYKYVNELTSSKELLMEQIARLKMLLQSKREHDIRQTELIRELERQLVSTEEKLSVVQGTIEQLQTAARTVTEEAKGLYDQLGCSSATSALALTAAAEDHISSAPTSADMLLLPPPSATPDGGKAEGDSSTAHTSRAASGVGSLENAASGSESVTVTEANLMSYMGTIEERANLILCAYQRRRAREQEGGGDVQEEDGLVTAGGRIDDPPASRADGNHGRGAGSKVGPKDSSVASSHENDRARYRDEAAMEYDGANGENDDNEDDRMSDLPVLPSLPKTAHAALSAQRLVRMTDLPSASLGTQNEGTGISALDRHLDEDKIVSHEQIRKQLERRLKLRDESAKKTGRSKDNAKDVIASSRARGGVVATKRNK